MHLSLYQLDEMKKISAPLVRWMRENLHRHCLVVVDQESAKIVEDVFRVKYP